MTSLPVDNASSARRAWLRALKQTASIERDRMTLPLLMEQLATRQGAAPALESPGSALNYRELADRCHRYARWGVAQGLAAGDVVALIMPNCTDYLPVWLGLTRIGVTVALINIHLGGEQLAHCIRIVEPKLMIVGAPLAPALRAIRTRLPSASCWVHGESAEDFATLEPDLQRMAAQPLTEAEHAPPSLDMTALYIYTSGTTGMPKAAKVSHFRLMQWSRWFAGMMDIRPPDRMYNCLPLYHSVGGVVACGSTLVGGGSVVIRERFSAADFWRDVSAERCTLFQYIGELCRYLVNAPGHAHETDHRLRLACGNGLRQEVWEIFKTRFRIPRILEYYAATEGNFSLYNCEERPGAIGRIPPYLSASLSVALVRFDAERATPRRGPAGFCERCDVDEAGEAIGLIPGSAALRGGRFEGYADAAASETKLLHDVFIQGDVWYRTGDLMRRDGEGFYYFVDRIGDTFRWKGENVSTAEVMSVLSACAGVRQGVVYGVGIPGNDGRAGMAALVTDGVFDLAAFRMHVTRSLSRFARPKFLRLLPALEATGTFKLKRQELVHAGFDPTGTEDRLYVDDARVQAYVRVDAALHAAITAGSFRID